MKSPYASQQRTNGSSTTDGDLGRTGSAPAKVLTFSIPAISTDLARKHTAFDALMDHLENDPENSEDLAAASRWVAEKFYADEGETLRTARLKRGLSQKQLAALLGTSQPHVANLEKGTTDPLFSTVTKLCEALSIDINSVQSMLEKQRSATKRNLKT